MEFVKHGGDIREFKQYLQPLIDFFPDIGEGFDGLIAEIDRIGSANISIGDQKEALDSFVTNLDYSVMTARDKFGLLIGNLCKV